MLKWYYKHKLLKTFKAQHKAYDEARPTRSKYSEINDLVLERAALDHYNLRQLNYHLRKANKHLLSFEELTSSKLPGSPGIAISCPDIGKSILIEEHYFIPNPNLADFMNSAIHSYWKAHQQTRLNWLSNKLETPALHIDLAVYDYVNACSDHIVYVKCKSTPDLLSSIAYHTGKDIFYC
jgi:hypothetical protein